MQAKLAVIGVMTCAGNGERQDRCRTTWFGQLNMREDIVVCFVVGDPLRTATELVGGTLFLPCSDEYCELPAKVHGFVRWALECFDSTYVVKCDDDTYIETSRFLECLKEKHEYTGKGMPGDYAGGGGGYILSTKSAKLLAAQITPGAGAEDMWVGHVLRTKGIPLANDGRFEPSSATFPTPYNDVITGHPLRDDTMLEVHAVLNQAQNTSLGTASGNGGICFWTVATGPYVAMARSLVHSYHVVGMPYDFHILTEEEDVEGAYSHRFRRTPFRGPMCKLRMLAEQAIHWGYEYLVYLDADSVFLRNVAEEIRKLVSDVPCQIFTEHDLCDTTLTTKEWCRLRFPKLAAMAKTLGLSRSYFNTNGGYFAVSRTSIREFVDLALRFTSSVAYEGGYATEEPGISFAALSLSKQPSLYDYGEVFAVDGERHHESYPVDVPWMNRKWATGEPYEVHPGILHAFYAKEVFRTFGSRLTTR